MKFFGHPVRSFNMEITNKCVLACSECDRTGNPWVKEHLTELPVDLVQKLFPASAREHLAGIKINLCGAFGDCIYHSRFHDIVRDFYSNRFSHLKYLFECIERMLIIFYQF